MSTQDAQGIPFSISSEFTNFRLLELPDELVKLLSSPAPPVLQLKSEATSASAVLCTESKTFPLRQVHTSNSLFIIEPRSQSSADPEGIPQDGFCAIASCGATLGTSTSAESAIPHIQKLLPLYSSREIQAEAASSVHTTLSSINSDIPLSDGEILEAGTQLCTFEAGGTAFRPTAGILLSLWKAILAASTVENINLGSNFLVEDLWALVKDEDYPRSLFNALLRRIADQGSMQVDSTLEWLSVDKKRCSIWLACVILETETRADQTVSITKLLELWRDHLLEGWRDQADLTLLQDVCKQPNTTTICLKSNWRLGGAPATPAAKPVNKTGKWHERFKKTK
ncbi:hypothetical protein EJ08DRAFT_701002 [Tothia fuscella]|uniref:Sister chromatid cohesion protein Dcc1 n=1 Tax=Tothia fuscella TaxID=1048955 RepID=A0A9P4NJT2_9PEZI|nr:hypothetical protein EJ08DRAFT_701002 [Tothia fuscella]